MSQPDMADAATTAVDAAAEFDANAVRQLLIRCWMTHDAMWFLHATSELGIETANKLNRAAVRSMAQVEAKRVLKLVGMRGVTSFDEVRRFFETAASLVIGDFMDFTWEWLPEQESVRFVMQNCFAFDGVTKLGVADRYECGIYDRVYGWLDALGVGFEVEPDVAYCTMHHEGTCTRLVRLALPSTAP